MKNETEFETVLECYRRHHVDSFSDLPGNYFWEEFFESCPKSKVRVHWIYSGVGSSPRFPRPSRIYSGADCHVIWTWWPWQSHRNDVNLIFKVILTVRDNEHIWFASYRRFLQNWHIDGTYKVNNTVKNAPGHNSYI